MRVQGDSGRTPTLISTPASLTTIEAPGMYTTLLAKGRCISEGICSARRGATMSTHRQDCHHVKAGSQ